MSFHTSAVVSVTLNNIFPRFVWAPKEPEIFSFFTLHRMWGSPKQRVSKAWEKTLERWSALMCDSEQTRQGLLSVRELMFPPPEGASDWCSCPRPHLKLNAAPVLLTPLVRMGNMAICQTELSIIDQQIKKDPHKTSSWGSCTVLFAAV